MGGESRPGPLSDIRILALTDYGAGPFCMQMLADLGADVVKIENPATAGDSGRAIPPHQSGTSSLFFESMNRGVRSVALDVKGAEGRELLRRMIPSFDAVFANLRGGVVRGLGLTYEHLGPLKRELVCCFLTGWGIDGPRAGDPAYDYGVQAFTGHMALTGEPGNPPARSAAPWVDLGTAMTSALAIVTAIHDARRTGEGGDVDVSMLNFAMTMWSYMATGYLTDQRAPQRTALSAHQSVVPSQTFQTADGYVLVMCQTDVFWRRLCDGMDLHELLEDERLATLRGRSENSERVLSALTRRFRERTSSEWVRTLGDRVPIERINTFEEAMATYEELEPDQIVQLQHEVLGSYRIVGNPIRFSSRAVRYQRAPYLGEHTREVLRDYAGCSEAEIDKLKLSKTIIEEGRIW